MVNVSELLINTVSRNERKIVDTLWPKGSRSVVPFTSGNTSSWDLRWTDRT